MEVYNKYEGLTKEAIDATEIFVESFRRLIATYPDCRIIDLEHAVVSTITAEASMERLRRSIKMRKADKEK